MDSKLIRSQLEEIFRRVFNNPSLQLDDGMTAGDVEGWDSLNHVALISDIETEFKIKFKLRELMNMDCVGDILRFIETKTSTPA